MGLLRVSSPVTVAGQRRILTVFPGGGFAALHRKPYLFGCGPDLSTYQGASQANHGDGEVTGDRHGGKAAGPRGCPVGHRAGAGAPASRTTTGSSRHPSMRRYAGAVVYEGLHSPDAVAVRSRECAPQAAHLASRPRKPYTMHRTAPRRSGVLAARRTGE